MNLECISNRERRVLLDDVLFGYIVQLWLEVDSGRWFITSIAPYDNHMTISWDSYAYSLALSSHTTMEQAAQAEYRFLTGGQEQCQFPNTF
jgi:hypothetical protein